MSLFQCLLGVGFIVVGIFILGRILIIVESRSGDPLQLEVTFQRFEKMDHHEPVLGRHRHRAIQYQYRFHGYDEQGDQLILWVPGEVLNTGSFPLLSGQRVRVSTTDKRKVLLKLERNGLTLIDEESIRQASGSRNSVAALVAIVLIVSGASMLVPLMQRLVPDRRH